ncbi:MAG: threonylcarbamoyl-AMP synthase [FCB group bacterium]|nr:threonylcarbamoyl-AMP synthase [FCB group bacterium]
MMLDMYDVSSLEKTMELLTAEAVFVYPTDTLYGFGGDARSEKVLETVYRLKNRPLEMPVSILVRDFAMMQEYAHISTQSEKIIKHFLPGALTLVLPAKDHRLPERLYSEGTYLGFRMPDHDFCRKMLERFPYPVITTSVNISGFPVIREIEKIERFFGSDISLFIRDAELEKHTDNPGSTVIKISMQDEIELLRAGKIPFPEIQKFAEEI